jgi:hypothetical protein
MGSEVARRQQRMLAEWASCRFCRLPKGVPAQPGIGIGMAAKEVWPFCDDLGMTGIALASTCKIEQPEP